MAPILIPPSTHRNRWVRVVACSRCHRVRGVARDETATTYSLFGSDRKTDPCESCGFFLARQKESEASVSRIPHLVHLTARWTSSFRWYDPRTWSDRGSWELWVDTDTPVDQEPVTEEREAVPPVG